MRQDDATQAMKLHTVTRQAGPSEIFALRAHHALWPLEIFNLDFQNSPFKVGFGGRLALNLQSRLEMFNPEVDLEFFNL